METINICLKVLTSNKKAVKESFQPKGVRKFSSACELIGFYGPPRGTHFVISDETTLAEAYSTEK